MLLKDKVALVTGAATGIGEAVARLFAQNGANLYLLDRDVERNQKVAESIRADGSIAREFSGDVRHSASIEPVVSAAIEHFGRVDILINNAGIYPRQPFLSMNEEQWDEMHDVNLKSMYHCLKLVLPHMVAHGSGNVAIAIRRLDLRWLFNRTGEGKFVGLAQEEFQLSSRNSLPFIYRMTCAADDLSNFAR